MSTVKALDASAEMYNDIDQLQSSGQISKEEADKIKGQINKLMEMLIQRSF